MSLTCVGVCESRKPTWRRPTRSYPRAAPRSPAGNSAARVPPSRSDCRSAESTNLAGAACLGYRPWKRGARHRARAAPFAVHRARSEQDEIGSATRGIARCCLLATRRARLPRAVYVCLRVHGRRIRISESRVPWWMSAEIRRMFPPLIRTGPSANKGFRAEEEMRWRFVGGH